MNGTTLSKRNKRRFHIAATKYVLKNHSEPNNDFQAAMNIAVYKAFIAGCEYMYKLINKTTLWNEKTNGKFSKSDKQKTLLS